MRNAGLTKDCGNQRVDEPVDKRSDNRTKRGANNNRNGEIDDVAAGDKFFETLDHGVLLAVLERQVFRAYACSWSVAKSIKENATTHLPGSWALPTQNCSGHSTLNSPNAPLPRPLTVRAPRPSAVRPVPPCLPTSGSRWARVTGRGRAWQTGGREGVRP